VDVNIKKYYDMRTALSIITIFALVGFFFTSCEPEKYEPIGEPFSKIDGVKGNWKITSLVQIDEVAITKDLPFTQLDITEFFNFSNYRINFNVEADTIPTTFTITNPDNAPNFVITSGKWAFDNAKFPSYIYLIHLDAELLPIDTTKLTLVAAPRNYLPLKFKFSRSVEESKIISYSYTFERETL
jgi:hypothetical protein